MVSGKAAQFTAVLAYRYALGIALSMNDRKQDADDATRKWLDEARLAAATAAGAKPTRLSGAVIVRWATLFIGQNRYTPALEMLDAELTNKPALRDDPQVRPIFAFMRGVNLAAVKRYAEAEPLLVEALNSNAKNPTANLFGNTRPILGGALAICRRERGDEAGFEEAVRLYGVDRSQMPPPPATTPPLATRPSVPNPLSIQTRPSTVPATQFWDFENP